MADETEVKNIEESSNSASICENAPLERTPKSNSITTNQTHQQQSHSKTKPQNSRDSPQSPQSADPHEEILGSSTDLDHENHQAGSRPEVDRGTAGRFIQHSITRAVPKRRLEEDEIEERLESGRAAPRAKLPEIRQVIKAGGWADEDESESSDEEDLKIFD